MKILDFVNYRLGEINAYNLDDLKKLFSEMGQNLIVPNEVWARFEFRRIWWFSPLYNRRNRADSDEHYTSLVVSLNCRAQSSAWDRRRANTTTRPAADFYVFDERVFFQTNDWFLFANIDCFDHEDRQNLLNFQSNWQSDFYWYIPEKCGDKKITTICSSTKEIIS
jgi:hypothetical protein